ncbi:MAG: ORF6N domain-containing protein [Deltaproteobacteria bacterium]|nr:ORF6N domain-containing protein [Deltaproteobacteria bacterium]
MKGIESPVPLERIQQAILLIRGKRVMLDADLARLYGVSTKRLNEQVKRNRDRFPGDFMFQLNPAEVKNLRSHFATSKRGRGGRRYAPYAFTEHGAIMLAAVLSTPRAMQVSVLVVRAFVRLREILTTHKALAHKLAELESKIETHDEAIRSLVSATRQLMSAPEKPPKKIGFQLKEKRSPYLAKTRNR